MATEMMERFKTLQKDSWSLFLPLELVTTMPAASLVNFARIEAGQKVLDVGCGTGVVALTAAQRGAKVTGLDLTPALIAKARENAELARLAIDFSEGDAEALPYDNGSFDVVLSQFGHMFAPRADVTLNEMLRVLKPGGLLAFSTWPPEHFVGQMFALVSRHVPAPGLTVDPPPLWGDPNVIRQRLGERVQGLVFDRGIMYFPALTVQHYCRGVEKTLGPVVNLVKNADSNPSALENFRRDFEALVRLYHSDNCIRQHFLMSKARKLV